MENSEKKNLPSNPKARAVVFGGSGFLGSHVADELSERGYGVTVYDREASPFLREDQQMVTGDILDREKVAGAVNGCDCAFSAAAISSASASWAWSTSARSC